MDPNATLAIMRDESASPADRLAAAKDLKAWVNRGGFLPITGYGLGGNTATKFMLLGECDRVILVAGSAMLAESSEWLP